MSGKMSRIHHAMGMVLGEEPNSPATSRLIFDVILEIDDMYCLGCRRDVAQMAKEVCDRKFSAAFNEELELPHLVHKFFLAWLKASREKYLQCAETNQEINRIRYAEKRSEYRAW